MAKLTTGQANTEALEILGSMVSTMAKTRQANANKQSDPVVAKRTAVMEALEKATEDGSVGFREIASRLEAINQQRLAQTNAQTVSAAPSSPGFSRSGMFSSTPTPISTAASPANPSQAQNTNTKTGQ